MIGGSRKARIDIPWQALAIIVGIAVLGIYNLSSSAAAREPDLYLTQIGILVVGLILTGVAMIPDYRVAEGFAYPFYAVVCLLLVGVLAQGEVAGGARRWLVLGPIRFQPSELAKIATIFCLARYFSVRLPERGYSLSALFRPLNPSRPIGAALIVAVAWNEPWLKDPVGSLARLFHGQLGGVVPEPDDLAWFRALLVTALVGGAVAISWTVVRLDRRQALLNPWPPNRRKHLLMVVAGATLALGLGLALVWDSPVLRDPFGATIATLVRGASPGGAYAEVSNAYPLRVLLLIAVAIYGLAAYRRWVTNPEPGSDSLIAPIDLLGLPALLILVEPDLGTAGIVLLIGFSMILVVGVRTGSLALLSILGAVLAAVSWFGVLKEYQKRRILTFMDPEGDVQGAGWNAIQSMIAVGSGRFWGKGHREGTQTQLSFLPEQHTDFAFSVWAEEQGFAGCALLLILFVALLIFALSVAAEAREPFGALVATGVAALIFWQSLINVGMVIGLMPVVGMTLPLFSYGGSSLLTVMLGMAALLNIYSRRKT